MGRLSGVVDRLVNTTPRARPVGLRAEAAEFHQSIPVVDLVVGTLLFRDRLRLRGPGHLDLERLGAAGIDLLGFTIATRHPDLRGTLSAPQFRSLGVPRDALRSDMAIVRFFARRLAKWATDSGGRLRVTGSGTLEPPEKARAETFAFLGIQGGHALGGDLRSVEELRRLGVRMLAPAHVMDNAYVGSSTGIRRGGLTSIGRELIAELVAQGIVVDLAHMSSAGIRESLPLLRRPFVVSHAGFHASSARGSWRRFSAANRNLSTEDLRLIGDAGGVVGVMFSAALNGGAGLDDLVRSIRFAVDTIGPQSVAIGSDLDGALRSIVDVTGMPLITQALLDGGMDRADVAAVMGGNALRVLRGSTD